MQAVVYKSTGSWYVVKDESGQFRNARIKGVFKLDDITSTNPVAVGDLVEIEPEQEGSAGLMITKISDRRNYINRQSPRSKYHQHIVAANVDGSLMMATIKEPRTSQGFIDRFLVACEIYHVPAIIVFNKIDLHKKKEGDKFGALKEMYETIGYKVAGISIKNNEGIAAIKDLLKDKTTLVSGHSGVGKSTFINAVVDDLAIKTQDVSGWSGKGQHTTTFAEMYDLTFGGRIIDTPGMKEFGIIGIERPELSGYFPEMRQRLNDCQFNNCLHVAEPGCAIKAAVAAGEIAEDRYVSYYNILESIPERKQY
jgi:ribosome biogenesis GTPase